MKACVLLLFCLIASAVAQQQEVSVVAGSVTKTTYDQGFTSALLMETSCYGNIAAFEMFKGFSANCGMTAIPPAESVREHHLYEYYTVLHSKEMTYLVSCVRRWAWNTCPTFVPGDGAFVLSSEQNNKITLTVPGEKKHLKMTMVQAAPLHGKPVQTQAMSAPGTVITVLNVSSNPGNASVTVDGNYVGSTPISLKITAGKHALLVDQTNYSESAQQLDVSPEGLTIFAALRPVEH
jgi:hypothetical protein